MANSWLLYLLYPLLLAALALTCHCNGRKVHVVYMGDRPQGDVSIAHSHHTMLTNVLGSSSAAKESLVYSYGRSLNGFAAKLNNEEVGKVKEMEGVVSVIPNHIFQLHTTRSWDFMYLSKDKVGGPQEGNVIVGVIDSGIWPEADSFNDKQFGPPPAKWKGTCQGPNFTCNNKLIGGRYYNSEGWYIPSDFKSPRDSIGHGTHTASTAAGREVEGVSYLELATGEARGGAPGARIAVYKVCWEMGCSTADILAAFDDAIADGVDIISVSLGSDFPLAYLKDPIAIGSFHAMRNGILTSNSAGNDGPFPAKVTNCAPWTLTVAASTIDRKFVANVVLGNGQVIMGISINSFDISGTTYPLLWGGDAANYTMGSNPDIAKYCVPDYMSSYQIEGKIVFCEALWDGSGVLKANGVGAIMADSAFSDVAFTFPLPATLISAEDGLRVFDYIKTSDNPTATILVGETWNDTVAPKVVSFSSRGPNLITPDILKPDITAPGVDILAAWSPVAPPSYWDDKRSLKYNVISGTSMSCPHATGAAAHVKAAHPDWSPAAIKSALMTTAFVMDPSNQADLEFAYGSGHINPVGAVDPGLIFDASEADYVNFLCKQGYNTTTLRLVTGDDSVCTNTLAGRAWDLNYPSFSLYVEDGEEIMGVFNRTVTNVGVCKNSTYTAYVDMPKLGTGLISVTVEPSFLTFDTIGEKKSFTVTVTGPWISQQPIVSGAIYWIDGGCHVVRTPVVVYNYIAGAPYNIFEDQQDTFSVPAKKPTFRGTTMYHKSGIIGRN